MNPSAVAKSTLSSGFISRMRKLVSRELFSSILPVCAEWKLIRRPVMQKDSTAAKQILQLVQ
jgi:hypothetical protein